MEDWQKQKDKIIERLFSLTDRLEDEVNRGEWDAMDVTLHERAKVFLKLIRLDRKYSKLATERDPLWMKQLEQIKSRGDSVYAKIRQELVKMAYEFKAGQEQKRQMLEDEMISPKGNRIEKSV